MLIQAATAARTNAYAPFSGFHVGAAVLADDGRIFAGSNVEASNYSLTMCAERVALANAITHGARRFTLVCVVTDSQSVTPPCGSCRQLLWELCGDIPLVAANLQGMQRTWRLSQLLPDAFGAEFFQSPSD